MKYAFMTALAVSATMILSSSCITDGDTDKVKAGDTMPEFSLSSEVYGDLSSSELEGKVVYLCFFATWCPPCQLELAAVQNTLLPMFGDEEDFRLVVVGREHTDADLTEYNKTKNFTFALYPDPEREVYSLFATESIPRAYLIDKDGIIVDAAVGFDEEHFDSVLDFIRGLLDSGSSVEF